MTFSPLTTKSPRSLGRNVEQDDFGPGPWLDSARSSQGLGEEAERERLRRICDAAMAREGSDLNSNMSNNSSLDPATQVAKNRQGMNLKDALDQLFGHINIDPDGGIGNLMHDRGSQLNKMERFKFGLARFLVAFVIPLRLLINVPQITWAASMIIFCHYSPSCPKFMDQEEAEIGGHINLPLSRIALFVAIFELFRGSYIVLRFLYHVVTFCSLPDPVPFDEEADVDEDHVYQNTRVGFNKYQYLAYLVWEDLQELQNFSAMSVLARVHPGLISHHSRECKVARNTSIKVLKRYLNLSHIHVTEEEVLDFSATRLLQLKLQTGDLDQEDQTKLQAFAQRSLLKSPYDILCDLKDAEDELVDMESHDLVSEGESQDGDKTNAKELSLVWRVRCIKLSEQVIFWVFSAILLVCGAAAFLCKLADVSADLFNPSVSPVGDLLSCFVFMNQVMGIVAVNPLMRMGLYRFIFGGHDAQISAEEDMMKRLYEARLAQAIWTTENLDNPCKRIVLLLTFESEDVQRLILEENDMLKSQKTVKLWYIEPKHVVCGHHMRRGRSSAAETLAVMWTKA